VSLELPRPLPRTQNFRPEIPRPSPICDYHSHVREPSVRNASDDDAILEAAEIIREGGVVAFPTETVYGLGADATNARAVARVFELKQRPEFDPLIVHLADCVSAGTYGSVHEKSAQALMSRFWPGPLTIVVPKTGVVPFIVTAGLDTVALRMPAHPAALALIRAAGRAIAAPSANPFGYVSPTDASHVARRLPGVDLILDGGPCAVGVESTIVSLTGSVPCILRPGGVPAEELRQILGDLHECAKGNSRPEAPGQLPRHYATATRLEIRAGTTDAPPRAGERVGLLSLLPPENAGAYAAVEVLSQQGDLREAAANLFSALHRLDGMQLDRLVALPVPEVYLGAAIMDRLRRCSAAMDESKPAGN
jgi:L-threonylcarbamoyladenylate synthase